MLMPAWSSPAAAGMAKLIKIDDLGNATLIVGKPGSSQTRLIVSRDAMRHASPVWNNMFTPEKWSESSEQPVLMPDDNPEALLVIMQIAHLQFKQVPPAPGPNSLLQMGILCDKYNLFDLVSLFVPSWMQSPYVNPDNEELGAENAAFTFYAFKERDKFVSAAVKVVCKIGIDVHGEPIHHDGQKMVPDGKEYLNVIMG